MTTIALINKKGGVGRTTVAGHLALHASERGIKTIAVSLEDGDALSYWLNGGKELPIEQLVWISDHLGIIHSPHEIPECLDATLVIYDSPPSFEIRDMDDDVRPRLAFKPLHPVFSAPLPKPGKYMHWRPGARPADFWFIPTPADPYGLDLLDESIRELASLGGAIRCVLYQPWKPANEALPALRDRVSQFSNVRVLDQVVLESPRFCEMMNQRQLVWEGAQGAAHPGARAMRQLCDEILDHCGLT